MLTSTAETRTIHKPNTISMGQNQASHEHKNTIHLSIRSLEDNSAISAAADLIAHGQLVAFQWGNVFGIALDGSKSQAINNTLTVKRDTNTDRKFSGIIAPELFLKLIDRTKVHPQLLPLLDNPDQLSHLTSGLFHLRAPVIREAITVVPPNMLSRENDMLYLQNLDTSNHPTSRLVKSCADRGIKWLCCTTLNYSGEPEIINRTSAIGFISHLTPQSIPLLLTDSTPIHDSVQGSFAIVDITHYPNGKLKVIRDGFLPAGQFVHRILGVPVDSSQAKPASYPHADFSPLIIHIDSSSLSNAAIRDLAVGYIGTLMVII